MSAWREIKEKERLLRYWRGFEEVLRFKRTNGDLPAIHEPQPSYTWDIRPVLDQVAGWRDPTVTPYNLALLKSLQECIGRENAVLAMDPEHAYYKFHPHLAVGAEDPGWWKIPALPIAEYLIFVKADFSLGYFGHPWEGTVCVFGKGFVESYLAAKPREVEHLVRMNGQSV